ncbi:hypothetical protein SAMN04488021_13550 [Paracoccus aminovorans]|uniref:Uncharacterized protein n=1 Tax=Paracoccus aminovorans TaxID=34004 RepID=A0A1I3D449_9RHOB|nr:hypothetical protein JCM7685_2167 [Paracoccus aminovorans]SFH81309.1 hypothetical protein SAMN04488021_13550 [Paracoccus aminovorans]
MLAQDLLIVMRTVLAAPVAVEDAAFGWRPEGNRHLQGPDRQIALHAVADGPADHAAGMQVQDDCQIQPPLAGPDVANVTCPFLVRPGRTEVAVYSQDSQPIDDGGCQGAGCPRPLFHPQDRGRATGFQARRINHDGGDPGEDARSRHHSKQWRAAAHPTAFSVCRGFWGCVFPRCIAPTQPIAIDEDRCSVRTVIDTRRALALGKAGLEPRHLRIRQSEKIARQKSLLPL